MSSHRSARTVTALLALTAVATLGLGSGPARAGGQGPAAPDACLHGARPYTGPMPPSLARLSPQRVWWRSRGRGVLVAVLGSGIDGRHPQLLGAVRPGRDLLATGAAPADDDCDGTGTFVAGLVAGRPDPERTTVFGVAPEAELLPVRILQATGLGSTEVSPDVMAAGVLYALTQRARVIVIYHAADSDSRHLRRAVQMAVRRGVVVVAGGVGGSAASGITGPLYPCHYPGVIGVAGTDQTDTAMAGSCAGPDVDVAAPGFELESLAPGEGPYHARLSDAGAAAGYVGGVAALLISAEPRLTPAQVLARLSGSADRPPTGSRSPTTGWGIVNPVTALTTDPDPASVAAEPRVQVFTLARTREVEPDRAPYLWTVVLAGASLVSGLGALAVQHGVRRRAARGAS